MHFSSKRKKESSRFTTLCVLFTTLFLIILLEISGAAPTDIPQLDEEAAQLLEELKSGFHAYESQLKSGVVDFTLTLHTATQDPIPFDEKPNYEEQGHWQITYQFDAEHQFYDVKARYKMKLNGVSLPEWTDIHRQYLKEGKTVHVWEKIGTEWKKQPTHQLEDRFNPQWWNLVLHGSKRIWHFKVVKIKAVDIQGTSHIKLILYAPGEDSLDPHTTYEIWIDPQKDYHVTRMIGYTRGIYEIFKRKPEGRLHDFQRNHYLSRYHTTYQLKKYEPGIWFPQTVTQQWHHTSDITHIFPEIPIVEVPHLMNEAFIAEDILVKRMQPQRVFTLQVEDAIFNIPIEEKGIPILKEK